MLKLFCLLAFITIVAAAFDDSNVVAFGLVYKKYFPAERRRLIVDAIERASENIGHAPHLSEDKKTELANAITEAYGKLEDAEWHFVKILVDADREGYSDKDEYIRVVKRTRDQDDYDNYILVKN